MLNRNNQRKITLDTFDFVDVCSAHLNSIRLKILQAGYDGVIFKIQPWRIQKIRNILNRKTYFYGTNEPGFLNSLRQIFSLFWVQLISSYNWFRLTWRQPRKIIKYLQFNSNKFNRWQILSLENIFFGSEERIESFFCFRKVYNMNYIILVILVCISS